MLLSGTNYTRRLPSEDERQELRDALERFEIPSTDLPPVALSPLDTLTISLPFPEALAYAGFEKLIAESGNAAAATDKDACRATLLSGLTFEFWPAEEEHRNFAKRNAEYYAAYRRNCQRDVILRQVWKPVG